MAVHTVSTLEVQDRPLSAEVWSFYRDKHYTELGGLVGDVGWQLRPPAASKVSPSQVTL